MQTPRTALLLAVLIAALFVQLGSGDAARSADNAGVIFVSTSGSDAGTNCKRVDATAPAPPASTACGSVAKGLALAQGGDIVQLLPGDYGSVTISRQAGSDSPKVIVRGDPALPAQNRCWSGCRVGNVIVHNLTVCGHGLSVQNLDSSGVYDYAYVGANNCPGPKIAANHDIDLVNVHFNAGTLRGHSLTLRGSRLGPNDRICDDPGGREDNLHIWPDAGTTPWTTPYDINLDGNLIYGADMPAGGCGGAHADLIQTLGYRNLTIQNNIFWHCADSFIQDGAINGTGISGTNVIRNNFFSYCVVTGGGYTQLGSGTDGNCTGTYLVENNTWAVDSNVTVDCPNSPSGGNIWRNNYLHIGSSAPTTCRSGTWDHNAFARSGITCGTNARRCTPSWGYPGAGTADPAHGPDLHLAASDTCLRAGGVPADTTGDIDGTVRPVHGGIDLGADQHESAAIVVGRSIGSLRIGEQRQAVEADYGSPLKQSSRRFAKGGPLVPIVTYRSWGGTLWAAYAGEKVVGVGTASSYYTGSGGLGVGAAGASLAASAHARWLICRSAYVVASNGVTTWFTAGGKARPVGSLSMVLSRYAGPSRCS